MRDNLKHLLQRDNVKDARARTREPFARLRIVMLAGVEF